MNIGSAYIEITNRCNLNCADCYNASGRNTQTCEIPVQTIIGDIGMLRQAGASSISFAGGEPTVHRDWEELVRYIARDDDMGYILVTNGVICSESYAKLCREDGRCSVQVSLDGSCEEVNSKNRGAGSFKHACESVRIYSRSGAKVRVKMVISSYNLTDVEAFYRMVVQLGAQPEFAFINKQGNAVIKWEEMKLSAADKVSALLLIQRLNSELGTEAVLPFCNTGCPFAAGDPNLSVLIKSDRSVHPCQMLYNGRFRIGSMHNFNMVEIEEQMQEIYRLAKQRSRTDFGCSVCINRSACNRGCMAEAFDQTGDVLGRDSSCEMRRLQTVRLGLAALLDKKPV